MGLRLAAALTGLVGGLTWITALVFERASGSGLFVDTLDWAGLFLLAAATLAAGASLVSRSALWLRVLVAVCFTVLVWSVLSVLAGSFDERAVYAGYGAVAVVVSVVTLARSRPAASGSEPGRRARGSHGTHAR